MATFRTRRALIAVALMSLALIVVVAFVDPWLYENHCVVEGREYLEGDKHPSEDCICDTFGDYSNWVCKGG